MEKRIAKLKKLQLSWETLRDLNSSEVQKVLGGLQALQGPTSCQSQNPGECC